MEEPIAERYRQLGEDAGEEGAARPAALRARVRQQVEAVVGVAVEMRRRGVSRIDIATAGGVGV